MPRGGKRVGAGRKKRTAATAGPVLAFTTDQASPPGARRAAAKTVQPPKGVLTREAYRVWCRLAPAAVARATLSSETAHGFAVVCQSIVRLAELEARLSAEGWTYTNQFGEPKRHPLWGTWQVMVLRVEQQLARYGLMASGVGGAASASSAAGTANPWAVIAKR